MPITSHDGPAVDLRTAATLAPAEALRALGSSERGLSAPEAAERLREHGANAVGESRASALGVLLRQLANPFLILLIATAVLSITLHDRPDAAIILAIVSLSVGLAFANEYTSAKAIDDLRARVRRRALVVRDGARSEIDVHDVVPGDVVVLSTGDIVPADLRLIAAHDLACDESALTGEALPADKSPQAVGSPPAALGIPCCAYLGTVVKNGAGTGVVVATGASAVLGSVARALGHAPPKTAFQRGLERFSLLLVRITVAMCAGIFACNALLHRSWLESLLFALAVAIGITPQLLPAIVSVSLSVGARRLARRSVIVKRLVSIEDLGNVELLFTDKTGTLTEGRIEFRYATDARGTIAADPTVLGLLCSDVAASGEGTSGGSVLDRALWDGASPAQRAAAAAYRVLDRVPFDYERRCASALAEDASGRRFIVVKGAPESILARLSAQDDAFAAVVDGILDSGVHALGVGRRDAPGATEIHPADERGLTAAGVLAFGDPLKSDAASSVARLEALGVTVKIITGDSARTAQLACAPLGLGAGETLTGAQIATMSDAELAAALPRTTLFARTTPEQKARIVRAARSGGTDVGFLGDGVNDGVALRDADVGISVDTAADVAKDAADIVLLEKDLGIVADGIVEGRRIFANTTKYVLMATSSNFGNMVSAAGASLFLPFLPMLPSQILLNNLLYDISEMAIPTDRVDDTQLRRPAHWDMGFIERFMAVFGPISSVFDFATFAVMLLLFHAGEALFRTGWFVESLATQSLVIFLIRTRRVPFFASRPSPQLLASTLSVVAVAVALPSTPLARWIGFVPLPGAFFAVLCGLVAAYLGLIEIAKALFFRRESAVPDRRAPADPAPVLGGS
ncbi:MAG TPA: magnesium-translocating P-type ATPase [Candidatus Baltobacteraceae bacterium]|nr:magnesium-translocating P-type ATPase [Candidatus Baltobacteraceae bacterium]